jgi:hypothetical protein
MNKRLTPFVRFFFLCLFEHLRNSSIFIRSVTDVLPPFVTGWQAVV